MATTENTTDIIDSRERRRSPGSPARAVTLLVVVAGIAISAAATVREVAVVSAMRPSVQLLEFPRLAIRSAVSPSLAERAEAFSETIGDPAIFSTRFAACDIANADPGTWDEVATRCLALIDGALATAPTSGELWLFKARILAETGTINRAFIEALANSYRSAPKEAWVAIDRVIVGLRVYDVLPEEVQALVQGDLAMVLQHAAWTKPVAATYARDPGLRAAATEALKELPADKIEQFVRMVRAEVRE